MKLMTASVVRPNDTTQYTIGDVISDAAGTLLRFGTDGYCSDLHSAILIDSSAETTKLNADLFLFDTAPVVVGDNSPAAFTDAEMKTLLCVIPFYGTNFKLGGVTLNGMIPWVGNSLIAGVSLDRATICTHGGIVYGVLVARNTYTPVANEEFTVRLGIHDD